MTCGGWVRDDVEKVGSGEVGREGEIVKWGEWIGDEFVSVERGEMEVRWGVVSKVSKGEGLVRGW